MMYTDIRGFEWDHSKARGNDVKHLISFKQAVTVFHDPNYQITEDAAHSIIERRQQLLGKSADGRVLVVIFTVRPGGIVRLISARPASRKERKRYEKK
jgi:uncharacterized DUF497 family protein